MWAAVGAKVESMDSPTPFTATFLFSDLPASARLWESAGLPLGGPVAAVMAAIRGSIVAEGGTTFKTVGELTCAVFAAPAAALRAAGAMAQQAQAVSEGALGPAP